MTCTNPTNSLHTDAQDPPKIFFPGLSPSKTYLCVNLDIDAPFPSWSFLGPILHWIQPGYKPKITATDSDSEPSTLDTTAPFIADYIGPAPPPGSAPHRYLFFLYEEPEGFDPSLHAPAGGKKMGNWPRMRYDFDAWAEEVKLGPVLAFNYFTSN